MTTIDAQVSERYGIVNYGKSGMEVQRDGKKIAIFTRHATQADNWQDAVDFCQEQPCTHPPARHFAWIAYDGTRCVGCCQCGQVLAGEAHKEGNHDARSARG